MSERVKGRVGARVGAPPLIKLMFFSTPPPPPPPPPSLPLPLALSLGRKTLIPGLLLSELCL